MSYSNSYNRGGNYRQNNGGGYNNNRSNFGGGSYAPQRQQQPQKKHSGCELKTNYTSKSGQIKAAVMFGWNYSRQRGGLLKFVAGPCNDTTVKNKTGKELEKWVAKVQWADGKSETMTAFYNVGTRKLTIPNLSMVANPQAPNGGYFGRAFRK